MFFRKREEGPQRQAEIIRAASLLHKWEWRHGQAFNRPDDLHLKTQGRAASSCGSSTPSQWSLGVEPLLGRAGMRSLPQCVWKAGPPHRWVWKAEDSAKEDYSQVLRSLGVCLSLLGPITHSFFPIILFRSKNIIQCLSHS